MRLLLLLMLICLVVGGAFMSDSMFLKGAVALFCAFIFGIAAFLCAAFIENDKFYHQRH